MSCPLQGTVYRSCCVKTRRGWLLLEMMIALAIFVGTAFVVLGSIRQGISAVQRTRERARAVDLARSTMAKLEAGLGTATNLSGPVPAWQASDASADADGAAPFDENAAAGFADAPAPPTLWEVEVSTLPGQFPGLTHVAVTVVKHDAPGSNGVAISFTLHQLVRLATAPADSVGGVDALTTQAEEGARSGSSGLSGSNGFGSFGSGEKP